MLATLRRNFFPASATVRRRPLSDRRLSFSLPPNRLLAPPADHQPLLSPPTHSPTDDSSKKENERNLRNVPPLLSHQALSLTLTLASYSDLRTAQSSASPNLPLETLQPYLTYPLKNSAAPNSPLERSSGSPNYPFEQSPNYPISSLDENAVVPNSSPEKRLGSAKLTHLHPSGRPI